MSRRRGEDDVDAKFRPPTKAKHEVSIHSPQRTTSLASPHCDCSANYRLQYVWLFSLREHGWTDGSVKRTHRQIIQDLGSGSDSTLSTSEPDASTIHEAERVTKKCPNYKTGALSYGSLEIPMR
jgi:hypothetical protein